MDREEENFNNIENDQNIELPTEIEEVKDLENNSLDNVEEKNDEIFDTLAEVEVENEIVKQDNSFEIQEENIEKEEQQKELNQSENLIKVRPIQFQEFEETEPNRAIKKNLDIMQDVDMHISVELGKTIQSIKDVMEMEKGSIVELDKIAGEQVEIYANDKLVARGEVIVIEDKFGVRIVSTNLPKATI